MARVLFAWEYGGDLGHARRSLAIARGLRALGHETAFAFSDLAPLGHAHDAGLEWFQAPLVPMSRTPNPAPLNFSDILLTLGFGDGAGLAGGLRGWRNLFALWKPDALVADYAPAALLAARSASLPRVAVGSGFTIPPPSDPLPAFRSWLPSDDEALRRLDRALALGVKQAFERIDARLAAPGSAAEVFAASLELACTWPELDPYAPRAGPEYLGPQDEGGGGVRVAWAGTARPRAFAYLKPRDARFDTIVAGLAALGGEAIVAAPGLEPARAAQLSSSAVRVVNAAIELAPLLPEADLCVSHAGAGLTARALAAGVPLALLPMQLEQFLVARRVESLGAGVALPPEDRDTRLPEWLAGAAAREDLRRRAASSPVRGRVPQRAAESIARFLGS